ncbi:hypothetical protein [Dechloromonas sp. HYN0024]|uniref:hypothetical protein n=1 Tax=Dechloromonas sp. HYN0024 TaxID=2231055 RepID=UPI000E441724|nr:hypothetical protein [Dechloromonas sp. HYN0024]AXS80142.1 hypothetical protein HYN24_08985 [Dechloromonas sp. HYN0024]
MKPGNSLALLWPRVRFHGLAMGWPALLGLALAAGAVALELMVVDDLDARIEKLQQSRSSLRKKLVAASSQSEIRGLLVSELVDVNAIDSVIAGVHTAARNSGVRLEQGDYKLQPEPDTRLLHYRIAFPAKGDYLQLRRWLDEAIEAQPGLMVEEFSLRRDDIGNDMLEARVSLGLLVRQP